jgi:starch-binding outer membrane protein, SusD/RagB family
MKLYKIITSLLIIASTTASCKKLLDTQPYVAVHENEALSSREGINASIIGIYSRLKTQGIYGRDLIALPEALADNGRGTNNSGRLFNESRNVVNAHFTNDTWSNAYFAIGQINSTLEAIPKLKITPAPTQQEIDSWLADLYFVRGLLHFHLVTVWSYIPGASVTGQDKGGVPIITKATLTAKDAELVLPDRSTADNVYTQVYADLDSALNHLSTGTGTLYTASKLGVQGFYSRVALYRKDYAKVKTLADAVLPASLSKLTSTSTFFTGFTTPSHPESLFEIRFQNNAEGLGVNVSLQSSFTSLLNRGASAGNQWGWGDLVPSDNLLLNMGWQFQTTAPRKLLNLNTVDTNDIRRSVVELSAGGRGAGIQPECTKYIGKNQFLGLDNVPVVRVAEVLLNRAEALATAGSAVFDEAAAKVDLSTLKKNRYFNYATLIATADNALTGTTLYEEIVRQRRIELAFEGHRFFDIKRLGRNITKPEGNLNFTDFRILPPIPQRELDGNPKLVQNFGY